MKEFAIYTAARLGLFVATYALILGCYVLITGSDQFPVFWPFLLAAVLSSVVSIFLLRGMRHRFAAVVERRADAATQRFEASRSKEDQD